jgi:nicotinate phosphoribosyltransferase
VSHSAIACFLGDTAEATMAFAATRPADIPRIALVDFRNDCVGTSRQVIRTMFARYLALTKESRTEEARKFKLYGVRPDTSANMRDVSVPPLGDKRLDTGVNPRLVFAMREAIDREWMEWDLAPEDRPIAERYCREVKIAVSGGFAPAKIKNFEDLGVPADIYGVGSWLLSSCDEHGTNNDYTADVVRVRIEGRWYDLAKTGRKAADNLMLERVQ